MHANAHKALSYVSERILRPADLAAMARHRRTSLALLGLEPQSRCPICAEEMPPESPGLVTVGCFHMYHRPAPRPPHTFPSIHQPIRAIKLRISPGQTGPGPPPPVPSPARRL